MSTPTATAADTLLDALLRRAQRGHRLDAALGAFGQGILTFAVVASLTGRPLAAAAAATLVVAAFLAWRLRDPGPDLADLAAWVDRRLPDVEHSAELLVADSAGLSPVARLQRARAARALVASAEQAEQAVVSAPRSGWAIAAAGLLLGAITWWLVPNLLPKGASPVAATARPPTPAPTTAAPSIQHLRITITPPAYTGRPTREVETGEIAVAEGAIVTWHLQTSGPATRPELMLDERQLAFERDDAGGWTLRRSIQADHVFRARLLDAAGEEVATAPYGQIAVVPDRPPRVVIETPDLLTQVGEGDLELSVRAKVRDDYGITRSALVATLALGAGEMVQFREQRLDLATLASGDGTRTLGSRLDLAGLGLEPGGELYLFVEAWDNRPGEAQRSRSATHVVRWPGAHTSAVDLGSGLPMILPPDTFRSQRQIIIDTERLLAERDHIDAATFAQRARVIAQDQHALRLRYGAMLGDEFEDGRPVGVDAASKGDDHDDHHDDHHDDDHDHGHDHGPEKAHHDDEPGSPAADHPHDHGHAAEHGGLAFGEEDVVITTRMMDVVGELEGHLVHMHDSEESANFFTTETKQVLKSSLANMWEAELRLHLADADGALPYAYRALRLLKEVQQASRVYVRRVGFDTPPLDPARRFTGDLDDLRTRRPRQDSAPVTARPAVRAALAALEATSPEPDALVASMEAAVAEVVAQPGPPDLALLEGLRTALASVAAGAALTAADRAQLVAGLWRQLPEPIHLPSRPLGSDTDLAAAYRAALEAPGTP